MKNYHNCEPFLEKSNAKDTMRSMPMFKHFSNNVERWDNNETTFCQVVLTILRQSCSLWYNFIILWAKKPLISSYSWENSEYA